MSIKKVFAAAALAVLAQTASATVLTDTIGADSNQYISATPILNKNGKVSGWTPSLTFTFEHNLLDNGFVVGTSVLESASLSILLFDTDNENEKVTLTYGLGGNLETGTISTVPSGATGKTFEFTLLSSLADLTSTGKLSVSLAAQEGAFWFDKSILAATLKDVAPVNTGTETDTGVGVGSNTTPTKVPEPASLSLIGLGLAVLGLRRRRA